MENKKSSSKEAHEQIQQQASQREKLERWAADRVKPWPSKLRIDDYDFRGWAKNASKQLMRGGAIYEYARESRKLRCLLALMNPKRPREAWEIVRPALIDGRQPTPDEINSYPLEASWLPCWFEDLNEHAAERALGGYLYCLADLADYLADNISFAELFRTKRNELEKEHSTFRYFIPVDAVEAAFDTHVQQATTMETLIDQLHPERSDQRQRIIQDDGSEVVALRIRWGCHTNNEIGAAMKRFAERDRPTQESCKQPQRKGRGREDTLLSALDNLSAMRLIRWHAIGEAIPLFGSVRLNARGGGLEQRKVRDQKAEAEGDFIRDFPFGEQAANHGTFVECL